MTADLAREVSIPAGARGRDEDEDEPAARGGVSAICTVGEFGNAEGTGAIGTVIDSRPLYLLPTRAATSRVTKPCVHRSSSKLMAEIAKHIAAGVLVTPATSHRFGYSP